MSTITGFGFLSVTMSLAGGFGLPLLSQVQWSASDPGLPLYLSMPSGGGTYEIPMPGTGGQIAWTAQPIGGALNSITSIVWTQTPLMWPAPPPPPAVPAAGTYGLTLGSAVQWLVVNYQSNLGGQTILWELRLSAVNPGLPALPAVPVPGLFAVQITAQSAGPPPPPPPPPPVPCDDDEVDDADDRRAVRRAHIWQDLSLIAVAVAAGYEAE